MKQCKHLRIYVKNPQRKKIMVQKERKITKLKRSQGILNTILQNQFSRVRTLTKEEDIGFIAEG